MIKKFRPMRIGFALDQLRPADRGALCANRRTVKAVMVLQSSSAVGCGT
jgi:hypothetical protein